MLFFSCCVQSQDEFQKALVEVKKALIGVGGELPHAHGLARACAYACGLGALSHWSLSSLFMFFVCVCAHRHSLTPGAMLVLGKIPNLPRR